MKKQELSVLFKNYNGLAICSPAEYLAKLKTAISDVRGHIQNIAHMPYPADPLLEPEFMGLTYYQVGLLRQARLMAAGITESLEFFTDRMIGKPAQVNFNINTPESYGEFLKKVAIAEGEVIDTEGGDTDSEAKELGL